MASRLNPAFLSFLKALVPVPLVATLISVLLAFVFWGFEASDTALGFAGLSRDEYHILKAGRWLVMWRAIVVLGVGAVATWNVRLADLTGASEFEAAAPQKRARLIASRTLVSLVVLSACDLVLLLGLTRVLYLNAFAVVAHTFALQLFALGWGTTLAILIPWPSLTAPLLFVFAALWDTVHHFVPPPLQLIPVAVLPPAGCFPEPSHTAYPCYTNLGLLVFAGASGLLLAMFVPKAGRTRVAD